MSELRRRHLRLAVRALHRAEWSLRPSLSRAETGASSLGDVSRVRVADCQTSRRTLATLGH